MFKPGPGPRDFLMGIIEPDAQFTCPAVYLIGTGVAEFAGGTYRYQIAVRTPKCRVRTRLGDKKITGFGPQAPCFMCGGGEFHT